MNKVIGHKMKSIWGSEERFQVLMGGGGYRGRGGVLEFLVLFSVPGRMYSPAGVTRTWVGR